MPVSDLLMNLYTAKAAFTVKVKLHMALHGAAEHILDNVENATIPPYKNNAVPD